MQAEEAGYRSCACDSHGAKSAVGADCQCCSEIVLNPSLVYTILFVVNLCHPSLVSLSLARLAQPRVF